jgi:hypothetical protein
MNRADRRAAEKRAQRYVLACAICGREFTEKEQDDLTVGDVERHHFMQLHDTTFRGLGGKVSFILVDRQKQRVIRTGLN